MDRLEKINKIIELRSDWTLEDYKEAYGDVWEEMPNTISECKEMMEEYIYHTYDDTFIDELLEYEVGS